ncbi:MAG TPA: cytochrome c biogenesis protein CcdA [Syntrophales bacterium]|nr:cytochrome c biogenesis protein CcdA [Syntrophales bacterium]
METLLDIFYLYIADSSFLAFPAVYLGGILISFTPCVYPVAPITIAFIGAHSAGSRWKGFRLSLVYVLGLALTYTFLGGIAALSGRLFGQIQANPWTYFFLANVCILVGLSMLGVLLLPWKTPEFLIKLQPREKKRGALGSFLVGAASGLVVGPCTAPVLSVLLAYVSTRQNAIFGMSLLFVFSLGLGTLLIVLGTFAGLLSSLPGSGEWMTMVNRLSGWILLAMGEYFLINAGMLWI